MKRHALLQHLRKHGCHPKREGGSHSLWADPRTGEVEAIPAHVEIADKLARKICRGLPIREIGWEEGD
jgi:predicted RNA binding protein YcfA (HicA-like mRNA interferase family)